MLVITAFVILLLKFTNAKITGFLVGGNYSKIEQFPYAVFISKDCSNRNSSCGASILNQVLLLSAAHCYHKCNVPFRVNAYTGAVRKFHGFESKVIDFRIHEDYNYKSKANDIALLKLETPLTFGKTVQRVVLMKDPPETEAAVVAGWGWIDSMGTRDTLLKHARQYILDHANCTKRLKLMPAGTICARDLDGLSYPEKGDSGSALIIHDFIQIGLVSFKKRGFTNDTIIYTYVPFFYDWIEENAEQLFCSKKVLNSHADATRPNSKVCSLNSL